MSNLRLINETTVSSSVSNFSVTDVFTSDFDIYKIVISNVDSASTSHFTQLALINSAGSLVSASNYDFASLELEAYASGSSEIRATNATNFANIFIDSNTDVGAGGVAYIFNPTSTSSYTFLLGQSSGFFSSSAISNMKYIGVLKQTSSITGFKFTRTSGTYDTFTVKIYGLRVDS